MARCFGASVALLAFWQLVAGILSLGMPEFNYLPDYLYPPAGCQWNPGQWNYLYPPAECEWNPGQWNYVYPSAEFEWNPGQYLPICEVCPQVQDEGPALLRADEAESLVEMDDGEVVIIVEEVVESKDNVMQQQQ